MVRQKLFSMILVCLRVPNTHLFTNFNDDVNNFVQKDRRIASFVIVILIYAASRHSAGGGVVDIDVII